MKYRPRRRRKYLLVGFLAVLAAVVIFILWPNNNSKTVSTTTRSPQPVPAGISESAEIPFIDLQPTIDAWAGRQSGTASVVIYDLANRKTAGSLNANQQYFTASIYKLYVAYIGYQKVADGTYQMEGPYLSGYNRGDCLDAMIRDSYSPCGEKMWNELGKENLTNKLKAYGLTNTSMTALYTSASDAAEILQRLFEGRDLTEEHRGMFLDSLKTQPAKYRSGLPSGFTKSIVYNKVGWNGLVEWHDTAIVTLPNTHSYVIVVLTRSVGSRQIAALGQAIEARLTR